MDIISQKHECFINVLFEFDGSSIWNPFESALAFKFFQIHAHCCHDLEPPKNLQPKMKRFDIIPPPKNASVDTAYGMHDIGYYQPQNLKNDYIA